MTTGNCGSSRRAILVVSIPSARAQMGPQRTSKHQPPFRTTQRGSETIRSTYSSPSVGCGSSRRAILVVSIPSARAQMGPKRTSKHQPPFRTMQHGSGIPPKGRRIPKAFHNPRFLQMIVFRRNVGPEWNQSLLVSHDSMICLLQPNG